MACYPPFTRSALTVLCLAAVLAACSGRNLGDRIEVHTPKGETEFSVMDFSSPPNLDPASPGWFHRTFFWHGPMEIDFMEKDGRDAVRLTTSDTASMLVRHVDVDINEYPLLTWQWMIEKPIETDRDEETGEGDDHPARFFITFETTSQERRALEIIWGNRLQAGAYKYIGSFPHYVARGGSENVGIWYEETVNFRDICRTIWPEEEPDRMLNVALFCDSDNTNSASVAYFADVRMMQEP